MSIELFRAMTDTIGEEDWIISDSIRWDEDRLYLYDDEFYTWIRCHANTRSVSYPNMIDKNGKKIFASLSEDGIGVDIMRFEYASKYDIDSVAMYDIQDCMFGLSRLDLNSVYVKGRAFNEYEVIGIHKG